VKYSPSYANLEKIDLPHCGNGAEGTPRATDAEKSTKAVENMGRFSSPLAPSASSPAIQLYFVNNICTDPLNPCAPLAHAIS